MNDLLSRIKLIFEENGISVYGENLDEKLDYDSLQFVSIITDIEEFFHIEFSDEVLSGDGLDSIFDFYKVTESYL